MNAYELADKLESQQKAKWGRADIWLEPTGLHIDSAKALRQQADRIAELKKCLFEMQNANIDLVKQFKGYAQQPNQDPLPEWLEIELRKAQEK